jgi:hypothetical protein
MLVRGLACYARYLPLQLLNEQGPHYSMDDVPIRPRAGLPTCVQLLQLWYVVVTDGTRHTQLSIQQPLRAHKATTGLNAPALRWQLGLVVPRQVNSLT